MTMYKRKQKKVDFVDTIIAFESGELNNADTIVLFSNLIKTGMVNHLQGSYGRGARNLILQGYLNNRGDITCNLESL